MIERPILFSGAMVRAILAGTKTQTRRVLKPQLAERSDVVDPTGITRNGWWWTRPNGTGVHSQPTAEACASVVATSFCPYGRIGDRLWVRETVAIERWTLEYGDQPPLPADRPWRHVPDSTGEGGHAWYWPHYRATDPAPELSCERDGCRVCESGEPGPHWSPSIHMPRWACRLALELTAVRVQRLHDISEDDARAEVDHIAKTSDTTGGFALPLLPAGKGPMIGLVSPRAREAFEGLWCSINGRDSWDANPWVWALTFKRAES